VTVARTLEFSNPHAPTHAVRVIQAEGARKGIIAMVVAGILAIVATLGIYAATSHAHGSAGSAKDRTMER
jgi:hypothetical protein